MLDASGGARPDRQSVHLVELSQMLLLADCAMTLFASQIRCRKCSKSKRVSRLNNWFALCYGEQLHASCLSALRQAYTGAHFMGADCDLGAKKIAAGPCLAF
jgi:hypothetical protein